MLASVTLSCVVALGCQMLSTCSLSSVTHHCCCVPRGGAYRAFDGAPGPVYVTLATPSMPLGIPGLSLPSLAIELPTMVGSLL